MWVVLAQRTRCSWLTGLTKCCRYKRRAGLETERVQQKHRWDMCPGRLDIGSALPWQPTQVSAGNKQTRTSAKPQGWLHCPATSLGFNLSFPKSPKRPKPPESAQLTTREPWPCPAGERGRYELVKSHLKQNKLKQFIRKDHTACR